MAAAALVRTSWNPQKKHSDPERWVCIYPAYIDSGKTVAEGRRIPKNKAVTSPTVMEIRDVLNAANLKIGLENKAYSREPSNEPETRGRIRVQLKNDDGSPINPRFPTRDSILLYLGSSIPQLKSRVYGKGGAEGGSSSQGGSSGGGKKKGGKQGRR